jgi:hypothetical protein
MRTLSTWHRWVGLAGVVVFLVSGISMRLAHVDRIPDGDVLHFIFRSRHIYLLFASLLNVAVGLADAPPLIGRGSRIGKAGSMLVLISPILMALGFFLGPLMTQHENAFSAFGAYSALLGMVLFSLATWPRAKRQD